MNRTPTARALFLEDGREFTYGQLNELAENLKEIIGPAFKPKAAGDSVPTPLVAVMMNRDVSFIATMMAILKCEGAYVPVDPAFPPDRQSHIFRHSRCELLVADEESYQSALDLGVDLPPYLVVNSKTAKISSNNLKQYSTLTKEGRKNDEESLAYVLYTSGSTGLPKGVMVKNIGVMNIINWFADEMGIVGDSVFLGLTTFCFDISVLEMFVPLTRGATLALAKSSTQKGDFDISSNASKYLSAVP